jgi:hypothetical protein
MLKSCTSNSSIGNLNCCDKGVNISRGKRLRKKQCWLVWGNMFRRVMGGLGWGDRPHQQSEINLRIIPNQNLPLLKQIKVCTSKSKSKNLYLRECRESWKKSFRRSYWRWRLKNKRWLSIGQSTATLILRHIYINISKPDFTIVDKRSRN